MLTQLLARRLVSVRKPFRESISSHPSILLHMRGYRSMKEPWGRELAPVKVIREHMEYFNLRRWGFVIFRCTYGDDKAWSRFMTILNTRTKAVLEEYYDLELMESLDWNVKEDAVALDGASKDVVRNKFRDWVSSSTAMEEMAPTCLAPSLSMHATARYNFCIHVDSDSLDSVVNSGPPPKEPDDYKISYVNLIDIN